MAMSHLDKAREYLDAAMRDEVETETGTGLPSASRLDGRSERCSVQSSRDGGSERRSPASAVATDPETGVNHPCHYNAHPSGVECIDVVEGLSFNVGNAVKYLWRAGLKDGEPDAKDRAKAIWYVQREIEFVKTRASLSPYKIFTTMTFGSLRRVLDHYTTTPEAARREGPLYALLVAAVGLESSSSLANGYVTRDMSRYEAALARWIEDYGEGGALIKAEDRGNDEDPLRGISSFVRVFWIARKLPSSGHRDLGRKSYLVMAHSQPHAALLMMKLMMEGAETFLAERGVLPPLAASGSEATVDDLVPLYHLDQVQNDDEVLGRFDDCVVGVAEKGTEGTRRVRAKLVPLAALIQKLGEVGR